MNSQTIELACNKIEQLLYKESPEQQQEIMLEAEAMIWDSGIPNPIRTDNPMEFCLDLETILKIQDGDSLPILMREVILNQDEPLQLIIMLIP